MNFRLINPTGNSYAQAFEITKYERLVFVSGQVPADENDNVPNDFTSQCKLVWANIEKQLKNANMGLSDIVKVTTFLSDRQFRDENSKIRHAILGEHQPALTVIIAGIYEDFWLLEIEVIAAQ